MKDKISYAEKVLIKEYISIIKKEHNELKRIAKQQESRLKELEKHIDILTDNN